MPETLRGVVLVAAAVGMGLSAGLFYAFAVSVMPGLGRTDARTLVGAMQQIHVAIFNGWFWLSFLGASALTALAAVASSSRRGAGRAALDRGRVGAVRDRDGHHQGGQRAAQ